MRAPTTSLLRAAVAAATTAAAGDTPAARRSMHAAASSSARAWWRVEAGDAATLPGGRDKAPTWGGGAAVWDGRRWMAVPKRKVTPSRRGIRNGRKHIPRAETLAKCSRCGTVMHVWQVPHAFCDEVACPSKLATGGSASPTADAAPAPKQ